MSEYLKEDQVKANISYVELFRRLWPYGRKSQGLLWATVVSILLLSVSSRLLPSLFGYAIDHGVIQKNPSVLFQAAIAFLVLEVVKSLSQWAYLFFFQKFGNRVLYYVREDLLRHVQNLPLDYFNKTPTGRIVTRLTNDVSNLGELFTDGVINVLTESVALIAILIAMSLISWQLALITMFSAPLFVLLSFRLSDRVRLILRDSKKKLSLLNSFVAENLNGIKVIQLYNRVPKNLRKFKNLSEDYKELNLRSIRAYALLQPVMNIFSATSTSLALVGGAYFVMKGDLALGSMVAFTMHVQDFIPPLREILEKYQQFQNSLTSSERVFQMLDEVQEDAQAKHSQSPSWKGNLKVQNLSFRYAEHLPWILKDLNFELQAGESLAIVGRTGSGKSTLITLLQKFYNPPENCILIDDVSLEMIAPSELRRQLGVVLQDNFIFRGRIRDNISLMDPTVSDEQILRACEQIGFLDYLKKSDRHLDSWVEERGANLSVGERQLLAFLRILAFQPQVLILDEATANVDSQTEELIHRATQTSIKGRTSLIIAHRLSTLRDCDKILVLENGQGRITSHREDHSSLLQHLPESEPSNRGT